MDTAVIVADGRRLARISLLLAEKSEIARRIKWTPADAARLQCIEDELTSLGPIVLPGNDGRSVPPS